jgi:hypothetical protein
MPLTIADAALDWALEHARTYRDTDIFPEVFEFEAIAGSWNEIKAAIQATDVLEWKVRPFRRSLVPKHRFGFRISTQLDPLNFLVFTALIRDVGEKLEAQRIPIADNIVHSYRFSPEPDGRMFSDQHTYRTFQQASHDACEKLKPSSVVIADIADVFPRLYKHRLDNAIGGGARVGAYARHSPQKPNWALGWCVILRHSRRFRRLSPYCRSYNFRCRSAPSF